MKNAPAYFSAVVITEVVGLAPGSSIYFSFTFHHFSAEQQRLPNLKKICDIHISQLISAEKTSYFLRGTSFFQNLHHSIQLIVMT
jgi:hypothetical protein